MSLYSECGKRALDLSVAGLGAIFSAPLYAACAFAIWADDGRPVHFLQQRAGKDGKEFTLIKFRTMTVGTHEISNGYPTAAMVTKVGRVLRKISLDELPQVVNIIKGDMSLIGPRPALLDQVARYTSRQRGRLRVRPGLTGLAQVRYRNSAPWSVRIESDLEYVNAVSWQADVKIALRTIPAVLFGAGVLTGQTMQEVDDLSVMS